jgi:hypothetical protein
VFLMPTYLYPMKYNVAFSFTGPEMAGGICWFFQFSGCIKEGHELSRQSGRRNVSWEE